MTNIFLITIDALRADRIDYINKKKNLTPFIDELAEKNISFNNAISTGANTPISFPGILTASYASEYYQTKNHGITLASAFKKEGYKTVAFNSNPHFRLWGLSRGLDHFEDFLSETQSSRNTTINKMKKRFTKTFGKRSLITNTASKLLKHTSSSIPIPYADAKKMNSTAFKWLDKNHKNNIFCWMHYMEPHYPYFPPERYVKDISQKEMTKINRAQWIAEHQGISAVSKEEIKKIIQLYDGEVRYVDEYIKKFIDKLKQLEIYDESIIVLTADHGEMLGEHERFGHGRDVLFKNQLHVPLIIKNLEKDKKNYNQPVSLIDLPYTISKYAGLIDIFFNGKDIWDRKYIISEASSIKREVNEKNNNKYSKISCQKNEWKLIFNINSKENQLFNLNSDIKEQNNLYNKNEDISNEIKKVIQNHIKKSVKSEKVFIKDKIKMLKKEGKI